MSNIDDLDDLESINPGDLSKKKLNFSDVYSVKIGGFGDPNGIKTYFASLSVDNLEKDINFYETLSKDKSWPISQIIQREVDKLRVSNISKDYVLGVGRVVKYFPPIIIAILPKSKDGKIEMKLKYEPDNSEKIKNIIFERSVYSEEEGLKKYFLKAENKSLIDGFYLLNVYKLFDFSVLCWDKEKYYAIVIDGQHRMDSLIKSKKQNADIKGYLQDVIFLEFSDLIKQNSNPVAPIEVVRRVFVDINTNAKRVGIVRQILMDDKDLSSLIVQSLVDSVNKDGGLKDSEYYLESELVDWYGESLKHRLPHLTGILSLYQIINDYLIQYPMISIDDRRSPNKVRNWVNRVNDYFFIDKKISEYPKYAEVTKLAKSLSLFERKRTLMEGINDELNDEYKETTLFNFDYQILEIAQESFEQNYSKGIVKFFNSFTPYERVRKIISDKGGFNSDTLLYKALLSSGNSIAQSAVLQEEIIGIREVLETQLYESYFLMYTVLGQKAVFSLLFKRIFKKFNKDFDEVRCLEIVEDFINEINEIIEIADGDRKLFGKRENLNIETIDDELLDLGTIASSFWEGIIYEDNKIIYNSQGIQSFASLMEYVILVKENIKSGLDVYKIPFEISFMRHRIKRILSKRFSLFEEDLENHASAIIKLKKQFIIEFIKRYLSDTQ